MEGQEVRHGLRRRGLAGNVGGDVGQDLVVGTPLTGPIGQEGRALFPNNIMMYKNTPCQKASEAFLTYYYKNMKPLWTQNTGIGLPSSKSIAETAEFKANAEHGEDHQRLAADLEDLGRARRRGLFLERHQVDGTPAMNTFTQSILGGKSPRRRRSDAAERPQGRLSPVTHVSPRA